MSGSEGAADQAKERQGSGRSSTPVRPLPLHWRRAATEGSGFPEADAAFDTRCMEAIAAGDARALQALMDRHWGGLVRYARRMQLSYDEAADVAQEVFVRIWEHRARWTPSGSARGYLYRIAHLLVLESSRHQGVRRRTREQVRARARRVVTPLETTASHELEAAIEAAIAALPERRRAAFVLVRIEGLGLQAAAEALGLARQTVANHVHLAVQDLQKALGPFLA